MVNIAERRKQRAVHERREYLLNELNKLGYESLGKPVEDMNLVELEQIHINEKCRAAKAYNE